MSSVRANVKNFYNPVYGIDKDGEDIDTYFREVGTKARRWNRTLTTTPSYNNGKILFTATYKQLYYKLSTMFVRLTFSIQNAGGTAPIGVNGLPAPLAPAA